MSAARSGQRVAKGCIRARQARPSSPRAAFGCSEIALQDDGGAVVEWVGERRGRVDPLEAVVREGQGSEEGRAGGHGMDCGAEVVVEAGEGEIHGADRAAEGGFGFEELDLEAGLREHDGGGKAVGACADDAGFAATRIAARLRHGLPIRLQKCASADCFCKVSLVFTSSALSLSSTGRFG